MSTVKTNNVQIGQSLTASQNFTWYQPASPDGTVRLGNGNAGSVTDLVTVGSTGNLTFANSISLSAASTKTLTLNGGAGSNGLVIDANNNVGIGYNTPGAYRVYVKSTDTAVWAANTSQSQIINYNAGVANNSCSTMEYQVTYGDSTVGGVKIGAVASASYSGDFVIANRNNGTYQENLRLTYSGNLGLGVTPSAWSSNAKALQFSGGNVFQYGADRIFLRQNSFISSANNDVYTANGFATSYRQYNGQHDWWIAPNNTSGAGAACILTQAMTLDASGRLLLGQTSNINNCILQLSNSGTAGDVGIDSNATYCEIQTFNNKPLIINRQGNEVRIGALTDQGAYNLQCNGTGVWGAGAYVNGSDERIKEDIAPIASSLGVINKLNPVTYKYKESWSKDINVQTGFIAQELQVALADEIYLEGVVHQGPEYLSVAYQNLIPILVKAIQELSAEIETLKQKVNV